MGRWTTLHLFDDKLFYNKVLPELRGELGDLRAVYLEFLKVTKVGGINKYSPAELNDLIKKDIEEFHLISNQMNDQFF